MKLIKHKKNQTVCSLGSDVRSSHPVLHHYSLEDTVEWNRGKGFHENRIRKWKRVKWWCVLKKLSQKTTFSETKKSYWRRIHDTVTWWPRYRTVNTSTRILDAYKLHHSLVLQAYQIVMILTVYSRNFRKNGSSSTNTENSWHSHSTRCLVYSTLTPTRWRVISACYQCQFAYDRPLGFMERYQYDS